MLGRAIFAACIYKTDYYRKVSYKYNKYGKLHDIIFLIEMNNLGDIAFICGEVLRWGQSSNNDSNNFQNGPFPNEIANIINDLYKIDNGKHELLKPLLWNFAYFLYKWSKLENYISWDDFKQSMAGRKGAFTKEELVFFNNQSIINVFNERIKFEADLKRRDLYKKFPSRF